MKSTIIMGVFLTLSSCTMKPQVDYKEYQELHKHKGTESYEVLEIIPQREQLKYLHLDFINKKLILKGFFNPTDKDDYKSYALKLNFFGTQLENFNTNRILNNGTDWYKRKFSNWLISGDTTKYNYIDPFSNKEIIELDFKAKETDPEKWLEKFKELYTNAQYIYI